MGRGYRTSALIAAKIAPNMSVENATRTSVRKYVGRMMDTVIMTMATYM